MRDPNPVSSLERLAPAHPVPEPPPSSLRGRRYGEDRLYLLVRDPRTVLALWELTPALHARAQGSARARRGLPEPQGFQLKTALAAGAPGAVFS